SILWSARFCCRRYLGGVWGSENPWKHPRFGGGHPKTRINPPQYGGIPRKSATFGHFQAPPRHRPRLIPPSSENACSSRNEVGVMSEKMNRTKMARPLIVRMNLP